MIRADRRRLVLLAMAKLAGVGALLGLVVGILMTFDGAPLWFIFAAPLRFGLASGLTLGILLPLTWWVFPGRVRYTVEKGSLTARRGNWERKRIPLARVASVDFDQHVEPFELVLTGWFGYTSPIPALSVTLTPTPDRWDPSNATQITLPRILIAGDRQRQALADLRSALGLQPNS